MFRDVKYGLYVADNLHGLHPFSWFSQVVYLDICDQGYDERNGTAIFDKERASDDQKVHIKLAYRVLIKQVKELRHF